MKRKQPKPKQPENIIVKYDSGVYTIKNELAIQYASIITPYGVTLYNIYAAIANRSAGNKWFVSLPALAQFLFVSQDTIIRYNWILEICKLIKIEPGVDGFANEYTVLIPEPITTAVLETISSELKRTVEGQGKNWLELKERILERIEHWKKLEDCGKKSQAKRILSTIQPESIPSGTQGSNGKQPIPESVDAPAELVIQLTEALGNETVAKDLIAKYGVEVCTNQLGWWDRRCEIAESSKDGLRSATGLLRKSIEGNWSEPEPAPQRPKSFIEEAMEAGIVRS